VDGVPSGSEQEMTSSGILGSQRQIFDDGTTTYSRSRRAIHADAFRVRAKMAPARETITAMPADDVPFGRDEFAFLEIGHAVANLIDDADKLVPITSGTGTVFCAQASQL
jgi:hypothetical protein